MTDHSAAPLVQGSGAGTRPGRNQTATRFGLGVSGETGTLP